MFRCSILHTDQHSQPRRKMSADYSLNTVFLAYFHPFILIEVLYCVAVNDMPLLHV